MLKSVLKENISVFILGFCHFLADFSCSFLVLGKIDVSSENLSQLLLYNGIMFGFQAFLGYVIDLHFKNKKYCISIGLCLIALGFFIDFNINIAIVAASLGNAIFHVSAASKVLSRNLNRATWAGIFIAPGGIGIALGTYLSFQEVNLSNYIFIILLLVTAIAFLMSGDIIVMIDKKISNNELNWKNLLIVLLLLTISIRTIIIFSVQLPLKENIRIYAINILFIAFGKFLGGVLTDKFGYQRMSIITFFISFVLLIFFYNNLYLTILGLIVLNMTIPMTLIGINLLIPKFNGLAFGLTGTATFIGSLPILLSNTHFKENLQLNIIYFTIALLLVCYVFKYTKFSSNGI